MNGDEAKQGVLANWELINRLALRRFDTAVLAEEAALYVTDALMENDARRVTAYSGTAPFEAYLASVVHRLLEDFSRSKYGRKRYPRWIQNLGGVWLRLYRMLCLERMAVDDAVAMIEQEGKAVGPVSPDGAAWKIKQEVVDCGAHQGLEVSHDAFESMLPAATQEVRVEDDERSELFRQLFYALTAVEDETIEDTAGLLGSVRIQMTDEEKLMLRLCYSDGLSVSRAGEMLGYNRHQMHGRLRRLLARIRETLEQSGIGMEILELLR